jgi:hypothetical protein
MGDDDNFVRTHYVETVAWSATIASLFDAAETNTRIEALKHEHGAEQSQFQMALIFQNSQ